ncbi:MAG TPA: tetratricopeptide repeat protein [Allosphingosinicella sp.]|nr:tetratricopeptide repeat protein [Allosphingosinicella sp.]
MRSKFLFAAAALLAASPATGAVSVIGNSYARMCYEAAEARTPSIAAMRNCDQALREDTLSHSDVVATFVNRGILKARVGNVEQAIADYDEALSRDPDQPEAYLNKGFALLHLPEAEQRAKPMFDSALAKKTRRPELAYYGRAVANELAGQVRAAYHDYREASRISPKWRDPKVELARFKVN